MLKRILLVDDDKNLRQMLGASLKAAGYRVASAANGMQALRSSRAIHPDAIILDLLMPGMDGFAFCENLRRHPETASIPILVLSGLSSQIARFAGLESGANDYLTKPFYPSDLLERLKKLLSPA